MIKKVNSIKLEKIWGYEKWLYSSYPGKETKFQNGEIVPNGPIVKIIKTTQPLSVQVHPDDKLAQVIENEKNGKSESWFILDAQKNSELILGMKNYDEKFIRDNINKTSFLANLVKIQPKQHRFYNVPAGLVHGLGSDLLVLEVQQCSDTTYRYYDYNRLENGKPRELHLDKALLSQKELSYTLNPVSQNPLTFQTSFAKQSFLTKPSFVEDQSIVVDLETFDTYFVDRKTEVKFKNYYVINWQK